MEHASLTHAVPFPLRAATPQYLHSDFLPPRSVPGFPHDAPGGVA
jgi:hypothetical protein